MTEPNHAPVQDDRRNFVQKAAALVVGGLITIVAPVAGLLTFLDPLRRKSDDRGMIRVASFTSLPENGAPRKLPVLAELPGQDGADHRIPPARVVECDD